MGSESSILRTKIRSIMKPFFSSGENTSINNTDTSEDSNSDTEIHVESSKCGGIAAMDGENDGSSRQSYHFAENLHGECSDETQLYDDKDGNSLVLKDGYPKAIASRNDFTSSLPDVAMLGNKEILERAEAEEVKNTKQREIITSEVNDGKEREMVTSLLGHRSRETYEPSIINRNQAEIKRSKTESTA
jgi:hypothetical protein